MMKTIKVLGKIIGFKLSKQPYSSSNMVKPTEDEYIKCYVGINLLQLKPSEKVLCIHLLWFHIYVGVL